VLEPHTFEAVRALGEHPSSWYSTTSGLFSEDPHLCLQENFWDETACAATQRYFIIDAHSGEVTRYASSTQAYSDDQYCLLLQDCGFDEVEFHPSLEGKANEATKNLLVITARK